MGGARDEGRCVCMCSKGEVKGRVEVPFSSFRARSQCLKLQCLKWKMDMHAI